MTGFDGKVAIVTGGGSGLGEAIGKALARKGVKLVLSDINGKGAERVAAEIRSTGGTADAVEQDTARPRRFRESREPRGGNVWGSALCGQQRRYRWSPGAGGRHRPRRVETG